VREREREYIIVWKRERNLSREEKEEEEKKKKKKGENPRNDGRNREGLFRRHTSDGRLCWEGGVEKGVSFLFLFLCAPLTSSFNPPQI
jgi:hypothetical protein